MNGRLLALTVTIAATGTLVLTDSDPAVVAAGSFGGLVALAAIWLAAGASRRVLAGVATLAWATGLAVALGGPLTPALACAVGLAASLLTLLRGATWPGWSSRYARTAGAAGDDDLGNLSAREMWESLDRGMDPTRPGDAPPDERP